jgi:hypothetical protein
MSRYVVERSLPEGLSEGDVVTEVRPVDPESYSDSWM